MANATIIERLGQARSLQWWPDWTSSFAVYSPMLVNWDLGDRGGGGSDDRSDGVPRVRH